MTAPDHKRNPNSLARSVGCLGAVCLLIAGVAFGISQLRQLATRNLVRQQAEWRQRAFDRVKQGDSSALVMDSKLLPMLANDSECKRIVTGLDFASTNIDASDAKYVGQLQNVTSMTFYCTTGTKDLLLAARSLPIADIHFEMPDLTAESYLILKDFPHLKKVRFEHVMDDEWIDRLRSELPDVIVDALFPRSKEPGMAN
jgi:hypothetical protein